MCLSWLVLWIFSRRFEDADRRCPALRGNFPARSKKLCRKQDDGLELEAGEEGRYAESLGIATISAVPTAY